MFFNYYLAALQPAEGHYCWGSLTRSILITAFVYVRTEDFVWFLSLTERVVGLEPGTFGFDINALTNYAALPTWVWSIFEYNSKLFTYKENMSQKHSF